MGIDDEFPLRLAAWLGAHHDLIRGLVALRELGPDGEQAVDVLMELRPVATMRCSFALWFSLTEERGLDPDMLLLKQLPERVVDELRGAVGLPRRALRALSVVAQIN